MSTQKVSLLGCCFFGLISIASPWSFVPIMGKISGYQIGNGMVALFCFIVIACCSAAGKLQENLSRDTKIISALAGAVACGCAGLYYFNFLSTINMLNSFNMFGVKLFSQSIFGLTYGSLGTAFFGLIAFFFTISFDAVNEVTHYQQSAQRTPDKLGMIGNPDLKVGPPQDFVTNLMSQWLKQNPGKSVNDYFIQQRQKKF